MIHDHDTLEYLCINFMWARPVNEKSQIMGTM